MDKPKSVGEFGGARRVTAELVLAQGDGAERNLPRAAARHRDVDALVSDRDGQSAGVWVSGNRGSREVLVNGSDDWSRRNQSVEDVAIVAQASKRPAANSIVATCEKVSDMSVETLDALARAAHATRRARAGMIGWDGSVALGTVGTMGCRDFCSVDVALG